MIDAVNLIPSDLSLPRTLNMVEALIPGVSPEAEMKQRLLNSLAELPSGLRAYLLDVLARTDNLFAVCQRYEEIQRARNNLQQMARQDLPVTVTTATTLIRDE